MTDMESNKGVDVFKDMQTKFKSIQKLLDDDKKFSTQSEPYKMKYEAIEILQTMERDIVDHLMTNTSTEEGETSLAFIQLQLGLLYVDTEQLKAGEVSCTNCLQVLKDKTLDPSAVSIVISALNQLGLIWSHWNEPMQAKTFLERAEKIYYDFKNMGGVCKFPVHLPMIGFKVTKNKPCPQETFESIHTLTLYFLAQVYKSLEDNHKAAMYCHLTLRRQLGGDTISEDLDYIDWALNAATLSQYFMENDSIPLAKHHLAAASYILQKYEDVLKVQSLNDGGSEEMEAKWENFKHRSADVARCWAKYGILLMCISKQRLLDDGGTKQGNDGLDNENPPMLNLTDLKFDILEKDIEPIASQITDKYLLDFEDARLVFLNVQKWLDQAKSYYTLEDHASDHIAIVQDVSQAYMYLAFFEEDEDRQAKMHKKRINILENVIKEISPRYYRSACRQIWIELGTTYSDLLEIKLDRSRDTKRTPQAVAKINHLIKSSIKNFQSFIDSLEIGTSNSGTELPDDVLHTALMAHFHIGRLYNSIISTDKAVLIENTQNSLNAYKFVIDYCEKHSNARELIKCELSFCKEIVSLLPLKIRRIQEKSW
ncbi:KIF-binding protein [Hylaeus volcanicus]|uniref:KIF-binding protein n=1 Tax=Hylaeus volcanicus TaxID=313075 RepID=UPI0023B7E4BC|nr:KIF-binding protein [Hylaeus volcanicus]